ncbi:hypothetical protein KPH14_000977 [Odynerus spinipes]|uniref:CCHC-type domain-containing protein n=1 Tax=Odynerus spinipes TaxID=1348599 RepID=A0AAD9VLI3_9HYME|nr:hypothetical protein KPH14_000977 [Odynerus spinipes]
MTTTPESLAANLAQNLTLRDVQSSTTNKKKQYYSVKDAAECIMIFDGTNVPASSFIRACENARDLVDPEDVPFLSRVIRSKIRGDADMCLGYIDVNFDTIIHEIKRTFVPRHSKSKWQTELAFIKQESYESPLQFGQRVERIVNQAKEAIREKNTPDISKGMIKGLEESALTSFIGGLANTELENKVGYTNPQSLREAIENAETAWEHIKSRRARFSMNACMNFYDNCSHCGKSGHDYHDCPYRKKPQIDNSTSPYIFNKSESSHSELQQQNQNTYTYRQEGNNTISRKICEFCKRVGHTSEDCWSLSRNRKFCDRCKIRGHELSECRRSQITYENTAHNRANPSIREKICKFCNRSGHVTDECRALETRNKKFCENYSGAKVNLIKLKAVLPTAIVNPNKRTELKGITSETIRTLAEIVVLINSKEHIFHIVPNTFPVDEDGILGATFLRDEQAIINLITNSLTISNDITIPFSRNSTDTQHNKQIPIFSCANEGKYAVPVVQVQSNDFRNAKPEFLVDTGAKVNIIKLSTLAPTILVNASKKIDLIGITSKTVTSLAQTTITINNNKHIFHVVPNSFPIKQDGILGIEFLEKEKAILSYRDNSLLTNNNKISLINENLTIPARTAKVIPVKLNNPHNIEYGIIDKLEIDKNVYAGQALVRNNKGIAYIYAINSNEKEVNFPIPTATLEWVCLSDGPRSNQLYVTENGNSPISRDKDIIQNLETDMGKINISNGKDTRTNKRTVGNEDTTRTSNLVINEGKTLHFNHSQDKQIGSRPEEKQEATLRTQSLDPLKKKTKSNVPSKPLAPNIENVNSQTNTFKIEERENFTAGDRAQTDKTSDPPGAEKPINDPSDKHNPPNNENLSQAERTSQLQKLLNLKHLNDEEKEHREILPPPQDTLAKRTRPTSDSTTNETTYNLGKRPKEFHNYPRRQRPTDTESSANNKKKITKPNTSSDDDSGREEPEADGSDTEIDVTNEEQRAQNILPTDNDTINSRPVLISSDSEVSGSDTDESTTSEIIEKQNLINQNSQSNSSLDKICKCIPHEIERNFTESSDEIPTHEIITTKADIHSSPKTQDNTLTETNGADVRTDHTDKSIENDQDDYKTFLGNFAEVTITPNVTETTDTIFLTNNVISEKCEVWREDCITDPQIKLQKNRLRKLSEYQEQIAHLTGHTILKTNTQEIHDLVSRNRRAPLNFIGQISKILFGTLDDTDADYYNTQIDKVYNDTQHMAELLKEHTNIVKSTLDKVSDQLEGLTRQYEQTTRFIYRLQETTKNLSNAIRISQIDIEMTTLLVEFDRYIHEYELDLTAVIDAILFAKQGILHPKILSPTQLAIAIRKIQISNPSLIFPTPTEIDYMEELIRISKLQVAYVKNRLIYILEIPLLSNNVFSLYKLTPIPAAQDIVNKKYAYVAPRNNYLAITANRLSYTSLTEPQFSKCKETMGTYICKRPRPLFHLAHKNTCEISLLVNAAAADLNTCDIRVITMPTPFWTQLRTPNTWIFSSPTPEPLYINCPDEETIHITINMTGILTIKSRCTGTSPTVTLTTSRTYESMQNVTYTSPLTLNITRLNTSLQTVNMSDIHLTTLQTETHLDATDLINAGTRLDEIAKQADELGRHKRTQRHIEQIHSIFKMTGVITIAGILTYAAYKLSIIKCIFKGLRMCCKSKKKEPKRIIQDEEFAMLPTVSTSINNQQCNDTINATNEVNYVIVKQKPNKPYFATNF